MGRFNEKAKPLTQFIKLSEKPKKIIAGYFRDFFTSADLINDKK